MDKLVKLSRKLYKISDNEKKIRKHAFFVKNFLEVFEIFFHLNRFSPEGQVLRTQPTLRNSIAIIRTEDILII